MKRQWIWLIVAGALILAVAAGLRLWGLPRPPAGPYYDEAANGILAADIAERGYRPIFITAYTGKEVLFFYGAALLAKLMGPGFMSLRLTSAIFGTLTVAATIWCAGEMYADSDRERARTSWMALAAGGLVATSFWHLAISRIGLRAVTQPLLQAVTLALLWRGLRKSSWWLLVAAGVACGLTGYTYLAARLFPLPLALFLATLALWDRPRRRLRVAQAGVFGGIAALVFAPLGLFFLRNPEHFVVRVEQVAAQGPKLSMAEALVKALGVFFVAGDPLPRLNLPNQPIFGPLLAAAFLLGLALVSYQALTVKEALPRARSVLLLSWIPIMVLPTALTVADIVPHFLRVVGLSPLVFLFPVLALEKIADWIASFRPRMVDWAYPVVLVGLLALTGRDTVQDYFGQLASRTDHYEISDGDMADMAGWLNNTDLGQSTVYVASIHYRHPTLAFLARDYAAIKWLTGGRTVVVPAEGAALFLVPRSIDFQWAESYLPVGSALEEGVPAGPDGKPAFRAYRLEAGTPLAVRRPAQVDFSHVIELEGYELLGEPGRDGAVDLVLSWQVLNLAPGGDCHTFVHLLDQWGGQWAETLPFQYPSAQWAPGERFLDRITLQLPAGIPPGQYWLHVGLYSPEEDGNLTVVGPDGRFAGIAARLPVTLTPAEKFEQPAGIRRTLDTELTPGLTLLGVNLDTDAARTRQPFFFSLFWHAATAQDNLTVRIWLADQLLYQGAPVHGTYSTADWRPGEYVTDRYNLRVPLDMPAGEWELVAEVARPDGESRSTPLGTVMVSRPERSFAAPAMAVPLELELGGTVELLGYDLTETDSANLDLTLFWRAGQEMEVDYTVYVHLLASDGSVLGQVDSMPQGGMYPTSLWAAGEVIADRYQLSRPENSRAHALRIGMYRLETGEQLGELLVPLR